MVTDSNFIKLKQLRFQSWHRGTRENDLILGPFADASLDKFDKSMLNLYQDFLNETDQDIFAWIMAITPAPSIYISLVKQIHTYHDNK